MIKNRNLNIKYNQKKGEKITVFSDTHGSLSILKAALKQAFKFGSKVIVMNGDFLNKKQESLLSLRLLMKMKKETKKRGVDLFITYGNHETWLIEALQNPKTLEAFLTLSEEREANLMKEMISELYQKGYFIGVNYVNLWKVLHQEFKDEINFLNNELIYSFETEMLYIVHSGPQNMLEPQTVEELLKYQKIYVRTNAFSDIRDENFKKGKMVITGHFISNCYRDSTNTSYYYNKEKNTICLDGGHSNEMLVGRINVLNGELSKDNEFSFSIKELLQNKKEFLKKTDERKIIKEIVIFSDNEFDENRKTIKFNKNSTIPEKLLINTPKPYKEKFFLSNNDGTFSYVGNGNAVLNSFSPISEKETGMIFSFDEEYFLFNSLDKDYSCWLRLSDIKHKTIKEH